MHGNEIDAIVPRLEMITNAVTSHSRPSSGTPVIMMHTSVVPFTPAGKLSLVKAMLTSART